MRRSIPVFILVLLLFAGVGWQVKASHPPEISLIPGYTCYKTIAELNAALQQIVSQHPQIAQLETIGYSYEKRPLTVIRLTNLSIPGPKPILFLLAGIHSNDAITPEVALEFSDHLVGLYGIDADITWLLDQHDLRILVSANPDGQVQVEQGNLWWQKNTHPNDSCASPPEAMNYPGVDLNQNFDFRWRLGGYPCSETFRGFINGAESVREPETQAVQTYITTLFDDYRFPEDSDQAIEDAEGMVINLQSPGERVLWPWSFSTNPAPNAQALILLGQKLASLNGYAASQASDVRLSYGSPLDWPYGVLGIASYTIQVGPEAGGNYPGCAEVDEIIELNLPALVYAAKVARAPYQLPRGPEAFNLHVDQSVQPWRLRAVISDVANGGDSIAAAEYYLDSYPWEVGALHPLMAEDGIFNEVEEAVSGPLPNGGLSLGQHMILIRGRDSSGNWGALSAEFFTVTSDSTISGSVSDSGSKLPIAGAQIIFDGGELTATTTTGEQGQFSAAVHSGVYTATVTANGYAALIAPDIIVYAGQTARRDFLLSPLPPDTGVIAGIVRDSGSKLPLAALVSLKNTSFTTESNPKTGDFRLDKIPSGVYTITASASGYLTAAIPGITVRAQQTTPVVIDLASEIPRTVDLHLSLAGPDQPVYPGGQYSYTLEFGNSSAVPITGVVVTATLPAEVDFVSTSPLAEERDGLVTWRLSTLDAESARSLRLTVRVKAGIPAGTTVRMDTYCARADHIPGVVSGSNPVDVHIGGKLFLPCIRK